MNRFNPIADYISGYKDPIKLTIAIAFIFLGSYLMVIIIPEKGAWGGLQILFMLIVPISGFYLFVQIGIMFVTMVIDKTWKPLKAIVVGLSAYIIVFSISTWK